jgi:4-hydroxy-tetrahydrodipicolinate synthase
VIPKETKEICTRFWNGDVQGSAELQCKYLELVNSLFCEVNPIPVKEALSMMGWCDPIIRSPLYRMEEANLQRLRKAMQDLGII